MDQDPAQQDTDRSSMLHPAHVFCGHSPVDSVHAQRLEKALRVLVQQGRIRLWTAHTILPGQDWKSEVLVHLDGADLVLFLLSPDFFDSDFCYSEQVQAALRGHFEGRQVLIPVVLRACDWVHTPLGNLQALPLDEHYRVIPIGSWSNADEAWQNVIAGIRSRIDSPAVRSYGAPMVAASGSALELATASNHARPASRLGRWSFVISGTVNDCDRSVINAIVEHLRSLSGDSRITLLRVEDGSVRLELLGTRASFERILHLHRLGQLQGQLSAITGDRVVRVEWVADVMVQGIAPAVRVVLDTAPGKEPLRLALRIASPLVAAALSALWVLLFRHYGAPTPWIYLAGLLVFAILWILALNLTSPRDPFVHRLRAALNRLLGRSGRAARAKELETTSKSKSKKKDAN